MTAPARSAALRALRDVSTGRSDLGRAQAQARELLSDPRDRALATEIVTGTLRWRAVLDHALFQISSRSAETIDPEVLDLLRTSAYQILYLDRVPNHAIVNDSVTLSRKLKKQSAAGFINAVLRTLARESSTLALPVRPTVSLSATNEIDTEEALAYLSTTLSHPRWLVERWLHRYGFDVTEQWASFNNKPAPITLRVNTLRTSPSALSARLKQEGVHVKPGRWLDETLVVIRGNPLLTPLAESGLFVAQDEASQLVAALVQAVPTDCVLDTCASPGGKTVAIAGMMSNRGVIIAGDIRPRRLRLLARTLARCGCDCVKILQIDGKTTLPFTVAFDWVLVDAPCSGLGTLRRDPDIRWKRSAADLTTLAANQTALLTSAAEVVTLGGRIVYSTCSSEPEENEQVVEKFLATTPGFTIERPIVSRLCDLVDSDGYFRTLPYRDDLEAFFAVVLRRNDTGRTNLQ